MKFSVNEIVDFFVHDICSKPIFCSKVAQKGKICSRLLEPQKVVPKGLPACTSLNELQQLVFG